MAIEVVLYTLGAFCLFKGLLVAMFAKPILKWAAKYIRDVKKVQVLALVELIVGAVLLLVGYFLK